MENIITWIESHQVTVGILQWAILIIIAWFSGVFRYIYRNTIKPKLEIVPTASRVFIEEIGEKDGHKNVIRASFIINAGLINRTNERIVLDNFYLSFETEDFWRSYRQKLLRIIFPSRPRKKIGTGVKLMSVFFTEYLEENRKHEIVTGRLEPKENCGGYLLFVSFTYGTWNPKIKDDRIKVKLNGTLTSGERLISKSAIRVERSKDVIEEFVPDLVQHVAHESTWNHDLSEIR